MTILENSRTRLIGVDVGGTFTDVVATDGKEILVAKVPTDPHASDRSVLQGAKDVGVEKARVFNLATTAGLNAIITRRIPKVAFLTTIGHRDILDKGRLWRPYEALTDPRWRRRFGDSSLPLVPRYLRRGVKERLTSDGRVLVPLDEDQAREELKIVGKCDVEGVAICLIHSWLNPAHELRLRELAREVLGDIPISISTEVSPLAKEYPRASSTTIDLLMKIIYGEYTARLEAGLHDLAFEGEFNYSDCSAMLMPSSYAMEAPYRLVVGGPAAGTVASAHLGSFIEKANLLCADVGGTSCDISVVLGGRPWVNNTFEIEWDLMVNALSTEVVTLGAGGGSIISVGHAGELQVGPDSAGADPGPACYGKGGTQPTVTDAALLIGILSGDRFLGGKMPLRQDLSLVAFEGLETSLPLADRVRYAWMIGLHNIAEGILDITIRRGIDPRDFSLMAFGAAGPMMLPALLDLLPLESVIVPPNPGGFSAQGLVSSDQVFSQNRTLYGLLDESLASSISELFRSMEEGILRRAGVDSADVQIVRSLDARLLGQGWETPFIPVPNGEIGPDEVREMVANFHREYEQRNGNRFESIPVEGVNYRVQVIVPSPKVEYSRLASRQDGSNVPQSGVTRLRHLYQDDIEARGYERSELLAGDLIEGPAIVWEENSTTFVPPGRTARVGDFGELVVR
jgi:N-methylhydantoinase A